MSKPKKTKGSHTLQDISPPSILGKVLVIVMVLQIILSNFPVL